MQKKEAFHRCFASLTSSEECHFGHVGLDTIDLKGRPFFRRKTLLIVMKRHRVNFFPGGWNEILVKMARANVV